MSRRTRRRSCSTGIAAGMGACDIRAGGWSTRDAGGTCLDPLDVPRGIRVHHGALPPPDLDRAKVNEVIDGYAASLKGRPMLAV
jgi:hypothetical protein